MLYDVCTLLKFNLLPKKLSLEFLNKKNFKWNIWLFIVIFDWNAKVSAGASAIANATQSVLRQLIEAMHARSVNDKYRYVLKYK